MNPGLSITTGTHVVDILGNVIGRDQPIMLMEKAVELVSCLDENILASEEVVFFDPFCKAGEILLACALARCLAKASKNKKIIDIKVIQKELYNSNRFFGLAPDERHHKLSLRTFLGNDHSHEKQYIHIIRDGHYLSEIDGRLDQDKFEKEFNDMLEYIKNLAKKKRIIAVGNPPYQEADRGAQASAKPIYNYFVEKLIDSNCIDEMVLVIPARWFSAGKGLDSFRQRMMESDQIKTIKYFERAEEVFPTVQIKGGICFLHWDSKHKAKTQFVYGKDNIGIDLSQYDIIPDDPKAPPIINKAIAGSKDNGFVSSIAWARKPFGLATNYFSLNAPCGANDPNAIKCYTTGRVIKYIDRNIIKKNFDKIDHYKVVSPGAYGKGMSRCTLPKKQIFILGPEEISTETYSVIGCFKTKSEAERFKNYLQTNFARYLLGLRKITQHIPRDRWSWVPLVDTSKDWNDENLTKYFKLTKEEELHIKNKVEEWS